MSALSPLVAKVRRRVLKLRNRLRPTPNDQIVRLLDLIARPPQKRPEIDTWCAEVQGLIRRGVLDRITDDDLALILAGLVAYRQTGVTPESTHYALTRAFENSSGLLQEVLQKTLFPKVAGTVGDIHSSLFGVLAPDQLEVIVAEIRENGYAVLPMTLDAQLIDEVKAASLRFSYHLKGGNRAGGKIPSIDPAMPPDAISAYADPPVVAESPILQRIANDELFVRVASEYLGSASSAIDSTFWYTFPNPTPSADTAQLFHYDLDTVRWLKLFIYFTDVGLENGPHEYVRASHRPENKAPQVLVKNYARIDDAEIERYYPGARRQVTGVAGTMFFGDTRCFHKGNSVSSGQRLVYSPIYATSRFGYFHG